VQVVCPGQGGGKREEGRGKREEGRGGTRCEERGGEEEAERRGTAGNGGERRGTAGNGEDCGRADRRLRGLVAS
jgi:hypothetical protein